jgi:putative tricarboxylic transport membrane protein
MDACPIVHYRQPVAMAVPPENPAPESRSVCRGEEAMFRIKSPQDVGAAVVFMAIGLAGVYFGSDLAFGTAARMGPGYFPIILSWIIFAIGVIVGFKGLTIVGPPIEPVQLRPMLIIVVAIVAFGYLIESLGLAITAALLTMLAGYARREVNLWETLLLAAGLAVFCVVLFVYGLSQPFPAWWGR